MCIKSNTRKKRVKSDSCETSNSGQECATTSEMGQLPCTFTKQGRLGKIFVTATDDTGTIKQNYSCCWWFQQRTAGIVFNTEELEARHEEADTRMVLHCIRSQASSIVVASRGTNVLVLLLADFSKDQDWGLTSAPYRR